MAVDYRWLLNRVTEQDKIIKYLEAQVGALELRFKEHEIRISRLETMVSQVCPLCGLAWEDGVVDHQNLH